MLISHVLSLSLLSFTHATHEKIAALVPIAKDDTCDAAMGKLMYDNLVNPSSYGWIDKTTKIAASACEMTGDKDETTCKATKNGDGQDCRWTATKECVAVPCGQKVADGTPEVKETCTGHKEPCVWRELSTEPKDNVDFRIPALCVTPAVKTAYDEAEANDAKPKCSELKTTAADCNGKKHGDTDTTCYLVGSTCTPDTMISCDATTDPVLTATTCTTVGGGTCEFVEEKCKEKEPEKNPCLKDAEDKAPDETACKALTSCTWNTICEDTPGCNSKTTKETCDEHTDSQANKCRFDSITKQCDTVQACEEKCWGASLPGKWEGWDTDSKFACTTLGSVNTECDAACVTYPEREGFVLGVESTRGADRAKTLAAMKVICDNFKSHFDTAIAFALTHTLEGAKKDDFSAKLEKCKTHMKTAFDDDMKEDQNKNAASDKSAAPKDKVKERIKFMVYSSEDATIKKALAAIIGMDVDAIEKDVGTAVEKLNAKVEDDKTEAEVGGAVSLSIARNSGALVLLAAWRHMAADF